MQGIIITASLVMERCRNNRSTSYIAAELLINPQPDQEGNKLQRQKILSFIYPFINIIGGILVLFIYI